MAEKFCLFWKHAVKICEAIFERIDVANSNFEAYYKKAFKRTKKKF